ncbi:MAG: hypothetical protein JO129_04225 [Candidatus Dependentiae bacterium]|nr:hypothetical protein [Candidatus Dependentiae bacterium]
MKRVIIVSMMLITGFVQAVDDASSKSSKDLAVSVTNVHQVNPDKINIDIENIHQINLDTTEIDGSGNWLNKRIWYERAQTVFDEIRVVMNTIGDLRIQFSNEVNAVGQKIDSFFEVVGFTKGQLDDKFKEILIALDTEQKILGDLSEEERNLQTLVKQEMPAIDQIEKDIKSIGDVDNQIDQTLMQAFRTIDECRDFESKAWNAFKAIAREIDDKKARNLYYQMSNYKQNIDQKNSYLKTTLLPYLHNALVVKIDTNIEKINAAIETLKNKGIDLEKIMSKSQDDDVAKFHDREKEAAEIAVRKALEEEEIKEKQAAEKAAQALAQAEYNSFSNVTHRYYDATVGKAVGFLHQSYTFISQLSAVEYISKFIKTYSYPVLTYLYGIVIACINYLHNLVESTMHYFVKAKVSKKVEEKVEKIQETLSEKLEEKAEAVKSIVEEKTGHQTITSSVVKQKETEVHPDVHTLTTQPVHTTSTPAPIHASTSAVMPAAHGTEIQVAQATTTSVSPLLPTHAASKSEDNNVAVQSIRNDDTSKDQTTNLYQVFKTVLDLIGTVFTSLYNCVLQLLKLFMNFASYVTSAN